MLVQVVLSRIAFAHLLVETVWIQAVDHFFALGLDQVNRLKLLIDVEEGLGRAEVTTVLSVDSIDKLKGHLLGQSNRQEEVNQDAFFKLCLLYR